MNCKKGKKLKFLFTNYNREFDPLFIIEEKSIESYTSCNENQFVVGTEDGCMSPIRFKKHFNFGDMVNDFSMKEMEIEEMNAKPKRNRKSSY